LIDGIGDANFVATELVGVKTRVLYEEEKTLLEELTEVSAKNRNWSVSKVRKEYHT
jgi:protease-4